MSSGSDSSGPISATGSAARAPRTPEALAQRIFKKLQRTTLKEPLVIADHMKAVESMLELRELLAGGDATLPASAQVLLTCAGVAVQRRLAIGPDLPDGVAQLRTTQCLLFVLIVLAFNVVDAELSLPNAEARAKQRDAAIAAWEALSLDEELQLAATPPPASASGEPDWSHPRTVAHPQPRCRALLVEARRTRASATMEQIQTLSSRFFQSSAAALQTQLVDKTAATTGADADGGGGDSFLTLSAMSLAQSVNVSAEERLAGIADCAESEAGQALLRDLILSFKLPKHVVGVRRTCLLSRESNAKATEFYSTTLGTAHDAAMRGARWTYDNDPDPVHKACALLAGIATSMCTHSQSLRKDDFCQGRVNLPFIETLAPDRLKTCIAVLPHTAEWIVYKTTGRGDVDVMLRQRGYERAGPAIQQRAAQPDSEAGIGERDLY